MKSMVVLIDTNVLLDFLLHRSPYDKEAEKIMEKCADKTIQGYIAFHSVSNIFFILRKYVDEQTRRLMLKQLCKMVTVTAASHEEVEKAIEKSDFKDFEDCLQDKCATGVNADFIVTRNGNDFALADTQVILPSDLIKIIDEIKENN